MDVTYNALGEPLPWEEGLIESIKTEEKPKRLVEMQSRLREWVESRARKPVEAPREPKDSESEGGDAYERARVIFMPQTSNT